MLRGNVLYPQIVPLERTPGYVGPDRIYRPALPRGWPYKPRPGHRRKPRPAPGRPPVKREAKPPPTEVPGPMPTQAPRPARPVNPAASAPRPWARRATRPFPLRARARAQARRSTARPIFGQLRTRWPIPSPQNPPKIRGGTPEAPFGPRKTYAEWRGRIWYLDSGTVYS